MADDFDAMELLLRLKAAGEQQELIVAQRPTASEMAGHLAAASEQLYASLELERLRTTPLSGVDPSTDSRWMPGPQSPSWCVATDLEPAVAAHAATVSSDSYGWLDTNDLRNPIAWRVDATRRSMWMVVDCLYGMGALVISESHIRAGLALARSAQVAAAVGKHLTAAGETAAEATRRALNGMMDEAFAAHRDHPEGYDETGDLIAFARAQGFTVRMPRNDFQSPVVDPRERDGELVRRVLQQPRGDRSWNHISAVAHSTRSGTLMEDEFSLPGQLAGWQCTQRIAFHALGAVLATLNFVEDFEEAMGWVLDDAKVSLYAAADALHAGSGLADEAIRSNLELPHLF